MSDNSDYSILNYNQFSDTTDTKLKWNLKKLTDQIKSIAQKGLDCGKKTATDPTKKNHSQMTVVEPSKSNKKNVYCSQKYSLLTFVPVVVFNQFRVFYNLYFLIISCAYFVPQLRVGIWWTNWLPVMVFLTMSLIKEGYGDHQRRKRDREINNQKYSILQPDLIPQNVCSKDIHPGDIIVVEAGQRVPADMILIGTDEKDDGSIFIKTDQLDGETDWKLRRCASSLKGLTRRQLTDISNYQIKVASPVRNVQSFTGLLDKDGETEYLRMENTIWGSSVIASGTAVGFVIYTGYDTKSALNAEKVPYKISILESEANYFAKLLFLFQVVMGVSLGLSGASFENNVWMLKTIQFIMILSYILPVSLRVNLDLGKTYYAYKISKDEKIAKTTVRNANVCEELGRISYILSDKTGTITLNEMNFKKLKIGSKTLSASKVKSMAKSKSLPKRQKLINILRSFVLCHNVTPTVTKDKNSFKGASTDEIALVEFAKNVGFELISRNIDKIVIKTPLNDAPETYKIIEMFPFTPSRKRMGVLLQLQNDNTDEKSDSPSPKALFLCKGAEEVVGPMTNSEHSLSDEVASLASEGLRTLVFASKELSETELQSFKSDWDSAANSSKSQSECKLAAENAVNNHLENNLGAIGVSGVEDRLRQGARTTVEQLGQAGVKFWMLTGDKAETAVCVGKSIGLITRNTRIVLLDNIVNSCAPRINILNSSASAQDKIPAEQISKTLKAELEEMNTASKSSRPTVLLIGGKSLDCCLDSALTEFLDLARKAYSIIICRSSPKQKARVTMALRQMSDQRVCAVGDGGNDVGMISVADVGIGVEGREGKSAALVADLAVTEFNSLSRLLLWHGRNSYLNSTSLAHLIFHRGTVISVMQVVYSIINGFSPNLLFDGLVVIGYTTVYTNFPVFSLVLDRDLTEANCMLFPEFYGYLQTNENFSLKIFSQWLLKSIYQGVSIMCMILILFGKEFGGHGVSVAFTALVISELLNISMEIKTWNMGTALALLLSIMFYAVSMFIFQSFFDRDFILSRDFVLKTLLTIAVSCVPVFIVSTVRRRLSPPPHEKVSDGD